tara:strand:- start:597 stop:851 length:255 start_codon:yes stop_codon:yes gene_type:complete
MKSSTLRTVVLATGLALALTSCKVATTDGRRTLQDDSFVYQSVFEGAASRAAQQGSLGEAGAYDALSSIGAYYRLIAEEERKDN